MPSERETYARYAKEYEALVSCEDFQGNILKTIREIVPPDGLDIVDLGAGTGRLACLLAPFARTVLAFDLSAHMLGVARAKLPKLASGAWLAAAADLRCVPVKSGIADVIVSGWSVSYVTVWHPDRWRAEAERWFVEARRVVRWGGQIILFESLGTGSETPQPLPHLQNFYGWLADTGFQYRWIRTDYRFESVESAAELAGFFFGDDMRERISRGRLRVLPECTGVWWMNF